MNSYTHPLTHEQVRMLRTLLEESGFEFTPKEWTIFFAQKNKLSVAVYEKGPKVLVQGKGVEEFVQFQLELDEFFYSFPLHQHLWPFFINGYAKLVLLRKENCPLLWSELEPRFLQQRAKHPHLLVSQRMGVRIHLGKRRTLNAQSPMLNSEFDVGR